MLSMSCCDENNASISHDQLQTQLTKSDVPSSSTSSYNHVNIIEENARLNDELTKLLSPSSNVNDACATNSISCEASILKLGECRAKGSTLVAN